MKRVPIFIACVLSTFGTAKGATLLIEGKYQSKNIYVQNAMNDNGVGFCAYEVRVNDQLTTDEIASSAFEIDLSNFAFKPGDKVEIKINHKDGCSPKVLNPDALKPRPTFKTEDISITSGGMLNWKTSNESGSLPFIVEQYRWNKWVFVGEVQGEGTPGEHSYSFQTTPHSGENKFRVKQVGYSKEAKLSPERTFISQISPITYAEDEKKKNIMLFSAVTMYEVYDAYGNIVLKGFGTQADLSPFDKGLYYLCYDNLIVNVKRR
ncbi:MAG: hypothetical protein FD123_992 [Bacteroidetes bacterium]|nr:MAG: hypothetical protein FD123_992 [Bacteroidota bacterium]